MKYSRLIVFAILGFVSLDQSQNVDAFKLKAKSNVHDEDEEGPTGPTAKDSKISGHNGGDEDELIEKLLKKYCDMARDSTLNKTS